MQQRPPGVCRRIFQPELSRLATVWNDMLGFAIVSHVVVDDSTSLPRIDSALIVQGLPSLPRCSRQDEYCCCGLSARIPCLADATSRVGRRTVHAIKKE